MFGPIYRCYAGTSVPSETPTLEGLVVHMCYPLRLTGLRDGLATGQWLTISFFSHSYSRGFAVGLGLSLFLPPSLFLSFSFCSVSDPGIHTCFTAHVRVEPLVCLGICPAILELLSASK